MAEKARMKCTACGYTTPWVKDDDEIDAMVEEIHHHTTTRHPEEVARIMSMPPGVARQRAIKKLEKTETRRGLF